MTELELIINLHKNSARQGPGSPEDTLRALSFVDLPKDQTLKVADIGCGSGGQTITLAQNLNAEITAVDLFPDFLEELEEKARPLGLWTKIKTLNHSMEDLPFGTESYDLIWSEGAIYSMGFREGIKQWKDHLKIGGYLAVSEITWITNTRPSEIEDFWHREYPQIDTAAPKVQQLEDNGYSLVGYFYLSPESWRDHFYQPLEARFASFLERHHLSALARKVVEEHRAEIELYERFGEYYSYGFYVARRTS